MKKLLDNYVLVFLLFIPFLYLYISYGIKIKVDLELVGFILFTVFFVLIYIYLFLNNVKRGLLIGYLIFMFLACASTFLSYNNSFDTIKFIIIILYLPIIILFFSNYKNKWINQKYLSYIYLIFTIALTLSYIFKFNNDLALAYKKGFIGLFYGSNIISPILAILMPIALDYVYKCKSYIVKLIFYVCTIVSIIFVGTKTIYASLIIYICYCLFKFFKKKPAAALIVATLLSVFIIFLPMIPKYQEVRGQWINDVVNENKPLINYDAIDDTVFHNKIKKARIEFNTINKHNDRFKFILNNEYEPVGIDAVDMILTLGIIGFIFYIAFMIVILSDAKLKGTYKLIFIMMIFASFFQGNIFTSYLVYIFIGILFFLSNEDKKDKKILLVSNMYPSKKNSSYGIFVKNTYDSLLSKYDVEKVTMSKHNNIFTKLFAYILMHTKVVFKMIFNDYDYIYIHFISHSSQGVYFASRLLKDVKIIYNAHGNDVVADNKKDEKNIIRSKKFLTKAYKVIVPSSYYKEVMETTYNINSKDIIVYPSGGIDVNFFVSIDKKDAKKNLGLDARSKYIGYISRIDTDKGYDVFVDAIKLLNENKKINKYKYIIAGNGNEYDLLMNKIAEAKIEDNVILYKTVNRDELVNLYNSLDLFVFPTRRKSDSLGLVGLEAMSCEVPLITSDAKGPMSYVNNKKNAYVFKQESAEDLADTIVKVLSLEEKDIVKLTSNERKTALEYDSTKVDSILLKVFK